MPRLARVDGATTGACVALRSGRMDSATAPEKSLTLAILCNSMHCMAGSKYWVICSKLKLVLGAKMGT